MVGIETFTLEEISSVLHNQAKRESERRKHADRRPTTEPRRSGTGISIIVHVPHGRSLRFASRSFIVTDERTGTVHVQEPTRIFNDSGPLIDATGVGLVGSSHSPTVGRQLDIGETLIGAPEVRYRWTQRNLLQRWFGTRVTKPYYVVIEVVNVKCVDCILRLPAMIVDTATVEFPEIHLREVREWYISPLNC